MNQVTPEYWTFPGDDQYAYEAIWYAHPGFLALSGHAYRFALWSGIKISGQTMERWMRMWAVVYYLDILIDNQPDAASKATAMRQFNELLANPGSMPTDATEKLFPVAAAVGLLKNAMDDLSGLHWRWLIDTGIEIAAIGSVKAQKKSLWSYARIVAREGSLTPELTFACMTPAERRGWRFRRFRGAFTHLSAGGVLFDHAIDLQDDYRAGLTCVQPSRAGRRLLLVACLVESLRLVWYPRAAWALLRVVLKDFWCHFPRLRIFSFWVDPELEMMRRRNEILN